MTTPPTTREAWREEMYEWCERNCKPGEFHFGSLIQIVYDALTKEREEAVVDAAWEYINLAKGPLMSKEQFRQHIIREINGL